MSDSSVPTEARPRPDGRHSMPDAEAFALDRDRRGWFYGLIAPSMDCAVLEVGGGFAENWLTDVVKSDLTEAATARLRAGWFDLVVLHYTL